LKFIFNSSTLLNENERSCTLMKFHEYVMKPYERSNWEVLNGRYCISFLIYLKWRLNRPFYFIRCDLFEVLLQQVATFCRYNFEDSYFNWFFTGRNWNWCFWLKLLFMIKDDHRRIPYDNQFWFITEDPPDKSDIGFKILVVESS